MIWWTRNKMRCRELSIIDEATESPFTYGLSPLPVWISVWIWLCWPVYLLYLLRSSKTRLLVLLGLLLLYEWWWYSVTWQPRLDIPLSFLLYSNKHAHGFSFRKGLGWIHLFRYGPLAQSLYIFYNMAKWWVSLLQSSVWRIHTCVVISLKRQNIPGCLTIAFLRVEPNCGNFAQIPRSM